MFTDIIVPEFFGTLTLVLLGTGVVANVVLPKTGGHGGGILTINVGWGLGVFAGVYVAYKSGANLNPAVTVGLLCSGSAKFSVGEGVVYILSQLAGAFVGAVLCWMAYKRHFDDEEASQTEKLAVFSTMPGIPSRTWNVVTEIIGTFVLVFVILAFGKTPSGLGPLAVALLVVSIGASLGGPTGYAINPARDLGPRIAHAILPIHDKGSSGWWYAWVPVVAPLIGGALGGVVGHLLGFV